MSIRESCSVHETGACLQLQIQTNLLLQRTSLTVSVEGSVDQFRIDFLEYVVSESHSLHASVFEVFTNDISIFDQVEQDRFSFFRSAVNTDALLSSVQECVVAAVIILKRSPIPSKIADSRSFDLDYLCTVIGKDHCA